MKKFLASVFIVWVLFLCGYYLYLRNKPQYEEEAGPEGELVSIQKDVKQEETFSPVYSTQANFKYFNFTDRYKITVENAPNSVLGVAISVPQYHKGKQVVNYIRYSSQPSKMYDNNGNKVAYFEIKRPKRETIIEVSGQVGVNTYDLKAAKEKPIVEILTPSERERYTKSEKHIESNDPMIMLKARDLKAEGTLKTVQNIYYFVQKNMTYEYSREDSIGAKEALKRMKGKCMEYAALMVALCRANGIPARVVAGSMINNKPTNRHAWVEVYLDKYGWVMFEPTVLSTIKYDFSTCPYNYMIAGYNILMPTAIKLKIFNKADAPQAQAFLMTEDSTTFYDANTNQRLSE